MSKYQTGGYSLSLISNHITTYGKAYQPTKIVSGVEVILTKNISLWKNVLKLFPLLLIYIIVILSASSNEFWGDESRYVMFATNLSKGYYSPKDAPNIWNGPGYPIVIVPFIILNLPLLTAKVINAFFLFAAVIYFKQTLNFYINEKAALSLSYIFGLYPPFFRQIHLLLTEALVFLLICGFIFHLCKYYREDMKNNVHLLLASFFLGYLALTKIFFGYVIMTGLVLFLILSVIKKNIALKRNVLVYFVAFLICTPWLAYTYSLTGKILYWGNSGGMSLYWMSSPYKNDLGSWHGTKRVLENPEQFKNHIDFFQSLSLLDGIQRDEKFKNKAFEQIKRNPKKYFFNWTANIGRLFFSYPFSYTPQKIKTFSYLLPNMFIFVISILCIYPTWLGRKHIPFEIWSLLIFMLISLGGSSLLSAEGRQFSPLVPIGSLWMIFTIFNILKIDIRN
jgi:hypothetical protein